MPALTRDFTITIRKSAAILLAAICLSNASSPTQAAAQAANTSPITQSSMPAPSLPSLLAQIDQTAQSAALDIAKLRIEKWKADNNSKQQSQSNAESLQRNLSNALPTLTAGVRAAPQALAPNFKLYRNLTALYDVLAGLTESAGAFGPNQEFDSLKQATDAFDGYRRSLGDYLETLTAAKDSELARLARPQQPATASRPKKIIVDNEPSPASSKKKSKKKVATPP